MRPHKLFLFSVAIAASLPMSPADARPRFPGILGAVGGMVGGIVGFGHHSMARPRYHVRRASMRLPVRHDVAARPAVPTAASGNTHAGWAGSTFWPHIYDDLFDYVFWPTGHDDRIWAYGHSDIVAAMFAPARAYADGNAALRRRPQTTQTTGTATDETRDTARRCASKDADTVAALVERLRQTVQPTDAQQNALAALHAALQRAFEYIDAACPTDRPSVPTARLDSMDDRLWSARQALLITRAPLETFYGTLSDEQKARLNGTPSNADEAPCGRQGADLPYAQIEQRVRPSQDQRPAWEALRMTSLGMTRFLQSSCPAATPATPIERLDAADKRLNSLLYAVVNLRPPLDAFYSSLGSEQKARFQAMSR